ncbi:hypothetical protein GN956_G25912 [Arapaima gigas]
MFRRAASARAPREPRHSALALFTRSETVVSATRLSPPRRQVPCGVSTQNIARAPAVWEVWEPGSVPAMFWCG